MKNYENLMINDEALKNWVANLMNINDHFLVHLTPNLKEEASYKIFNVSYKELKNLIVATKNYSFVLDNAGSDEVKKIAINAIRAMIKNHVNSLNKDVQKVEKMSSLENNAQA